MSEMIEITVKLPADLVQDAEEFNLLTDTAVAQLLRAALDERVNEMVNAEIHTYRQEKRAKSS